MREINYGGKIVQQFDEELKVFRTSDIGIAAAVLSAESKPTLKEVVPETPGGSRYLFVIAGDVGIIKADVLKWWSGELHVNAKEYFYNYRRLKREVGDKKR